MNTKNRIIGVKILVMMVLPLIGAAAMFSLIHAFQLEKGNMLGAGVYTLGIVLLGLGVPYVMLKTLFSAAHTQNPGQEKEIHMADMPDDKDEIAHKLDAHSH